MAPGLVLFLALEVMVLVGIMSYSARLQLLFSAAMIVLPWASVLISDAGLGELGYHPDRLLLHLGWGMVAGGTWRILSVLFNLWGLGISGLWAISTQLLAAVFWVPFLEETFFRGYLGKSLVNKFGALPGILIQSTLFTLLPAHTSQGAWNLISIFGFGLLAGWLMHVRKSIWAPWGAHAFANLLPLLVIIIK